MASARTARRRLGPALAVLLMLAGVPASAQVAFDDHAATVVRLRGSATATDLRGDERSLAVDDVVFVGDTIATGSGRIVFLTLRFRDDTTFALGRASTMRISDFTYQQPAQEDKIGASVLKGVFRFVSGLIAKARSRSMAVEVPVATIGIRGTHVGGEVDGDRATIVLLEPAEPGGAVGAIEVANQHGSVNIDTEGFGTEIPDANSPPSPPRRMRMRTIENLVRSLQAIARPRPRIR